MDGSHAGSEGIPSRRDRRWHPRVALARHSPSPPRQAAAPSTSLSARSCSSRSWTGRATVTTFGADLSCSPRRRLSTSPRRSSPGAPDGLRSHRLTAHGLGDRLHAVILKIPIVYLCVSSGMRSRLWGSPPDEREAAPVLSDTPRPVGSPPSALRRPPACTPAHTWPSARHRAAPAPGWSARVEHSRGSTRSTLCDRRRRGSPRSRIHGALRDCDGFRPDPGDRCAAGPISLLRDHPRARLGPDQRPLPFSCPQGVSVRDGGLGRAG